ncbi:MAG: hypothetical protein NTX42_04355 [Methanothrix sp.]|nr:hypothetical protein [Methanothrix sp.]
MPEGMPGMVVPPPNPIPMKARKKKGEAMDPKTRLFRRKKRSISRSQML